MSDMVFMEICTICGGLGGENLRCDRGELISKADMLAFINCYTTGRYDSHFRVYEFNYRGMRAIEKQGGCYSYGCDQRYVRFTDLILFSFKKFKSGKYPSRLYKKIWLEEED